MNYTPIRLRLKDNLYDTRCVYAKAFKGKGDEGGEAERDKRSVFITGLPVWVREEEQIKKAFSFFGEVESIVLHPSKISCVVVYTDKNYKSTVLNTFNKLLSVVAPQKRNTLGFQSWLQEHQKKFPGNEKLQTEVDKWMISQEEAKRKVKMELEKKQAENGWRIVKSKRNRKVDSIEDLELAKASLHKKAKNKKKKKVFVKNLDEIDKKIDKIESKVIKNERFGQDKKDIAAIRASRKFNG